MKSNAIVRIVIWSVVILVLLAVLIAGLANNLFTMFHGSTDTVYHSTDVAASESPSGQSDTPIAERSVSVVSQTSVYTMPNTQSASVGALNVGDNVVIDRSEEVGGDSWIHITSPVDGWVNAECLKLNGVNQTDSRSKWRRKIRQYKLRHPPLLRLNLLSFDTTSLQAGNEIFLAADEDDEHGEQACHRHGKDVAPLGELMLAEKA